jgi:hypothetical protein
MAEKKSGGFFKGLLIAAGVTAITAGAAYVLYKTLKKHFKFKIELTSPDGDCICDGEENCICDSDPEKEIDVTSIELSEDEEVNMCPDGCDACDENGHCTR